MSRTANPIFRTTLPSGLTVLVETLPYVRSVAMGYYLRSGSAVESEEHGGASHFLEHLVFKGTDKRNTAEIAQIIDILGGDVDAFTGKEYTSFYAHVLDEQVPTALELLTEIVTAPRFSDEDVEMERGVILEEIKMVEDTPDDLVHEIFVTAFWPDHPLGRPILGTEETIERLQRAKIVEHYQETFQPSNVIFAASGNVRPEQLVPFLEAQFPPDARAPFRREWDAPSPRQHVIVREKRELEQAHLCLGTRGYPQQGPERFGAALFNTILGGGMSSRLFQRVREQEGLVYSIASYHNGYLHGGYEAVYAACAPKNLRRVLDITLAEMRAVKAQGVTAGELSAAKLHLKGSILLSLESTVSRMSGIARQEYYFGRQFSPDEIIAAIDAVTLEDIHAIAQTIVDPDSVSLTMLGNLKDPGITTAMLRDALA
ncbi:MAG: insulinase family protein [Acidobacteria bacterium]|nr:insulinase family protein [Acidobacteriota bacterium]MBV9478036.1 insulinase family protein [Acidobacteriota bacterium]